MNEPRMPVLLVAIETSGPVGSVAALLDGEPAAEVSFEKGMRHGRELVPRLAAMCEGLQRAPDSIDAVAVSAGPGSYTGLRVGVTCAKTLAFAVGAGLVGVPTLEVLAQNAKIGGQHTGFRSGQDPVSVSCCPPIFVAALVDARRGQVYAALFRREGQALARQSEDLVLDPAEAIARIAPGTFVLGDAVIRYADLLDSAREAIPGLRLGTPEQAQATAGHVASLGWQRFQAGETTPPHDLVPIYLRRPEAVDRLLKRKGSTP